MSRLALLALVFAAGCAPDAPLGSGAPLPTIALPDTLRIDSNATSLADRPGAPLIIDGACPFEGCWYSEWTTSDVTTVYAASGDTTSAAFTVPAGTVLDADRGFVIVTHLGRAVAQRAAEIYANVQGPTPVAAGDTLSILDYVGEGHYRVWAAGTLGLSGDVIPHDDDDTFDLLDEPHVQWWAHVTLAEPTEPVGRRSGWLWMERTPFMDGADSLG